MTHTSVVIQDDKEFISIKKKALDLGLDHSQLFWVGALAYKPKKGDIKGMEVYMEVDDTPTDVFNLKQWKRYGKNHNKELKKFILDLDKIYQGLKK
jgi:hypothetical protein